MSGCADGGRHVRLCRWRKACQAVQMEEGMSGCADGGRHVRLCRWRKACQAVQMEEGMLVTHRLQS